MIVPGETKNRQSQETAEPTRTIVLNDRPISNKDFLYTYAAIKRTLCQIVTSFFQNGSASRPVRVLQPRKLSLQRSCGSPTMGVYRNNVAGARPMPNSDGRPAPPTCTSPMICALSAIEGGFVEFADGRRG
jgi:hypothetical protein